MDVTGRNIRITMVRESLDGIPEFALPAAYALRWYQPGDERLWLSIQAPADHYNAITPELFTRQFGTDRALLEQRQCYLLNEGGRGIGTATAWFNDDFNGRRYGRVHWVAILPQYQGYGLAKPLMTLVCRRLRDLGHDRAYLTTSTARIAAINLYFHFGFVPMICTTDDAAVWRRVQERLDELGETAGPAENI